MDINKVIIDGNATPKTVTVRGNITPIGEKIVYDAVWGSITGEIEHQEDLMEQLYERDTDALSVQDVEKILYVG